MYVHAYQHRVRYRECDRMGVVYHAHYVDYFEAARTEALREVGVVYKDLEDSGTLLLVTEYAAQFKKPAYYDDLLEVSSIFREIPRARIEIEYEVRRVDEEGVLATGQVTLCFFNKARKRPIPAPEPIRTLFARLLDV